MTPLHLSLEQILDQSEVDLNLEKDRLADETVRTPRIFSKYNKMLSVEKVRLRKLEFTIKKEEKVAWEYYAGKLGDKEHIPRKGDDREGNLKISKERVPKYMEADDQLIELRINLAIQEEKVAALERILKAVNERQWNIRNIIEYEKFMAGL